MAAMLGAVKKLPPQQQRQIWLLVTTRSAQSCAMAMLAAGAANDLFLELNGGDFARTQRLLSLIASTNTVADFVMAPIIGGAIDAFGRKYSLIFGQAIDCAVRMLVALRPTVGTFFLYRLLREVARRLVIPSRAAMFGDYVGRGSEDYILITQLMAQVATLARTVTLQIGSRSIRDGDFRRNFMVAAVFAEQFVPMLFVGRFSECELAIFYYDKPRAVETAESDEQRCLLSRPSTRWACWPLVSCRSHWQSHYGNRCR
jgi:MFS family permease